MDNMLSMPVMLIFEVTIHSSLFQKQGVRSSTSSQASSLSSPRGEPPQMDDINGRGQMGEPSRSMQIPPRFHADYRDDSGK